MNSVPEETSTKKKKHSRKKNKSNLNSFRTVDDENKTKPLKKGSKTSTEPYKPISISNSTASGLSLEPPKSILNRCAPPSTEQSNSSDYDFVELLEKGKKLRDAMVLSVLDDIDSDLDKDLLLKMETTPKENSGTQMHNLSSSNNTLMIHKKEELTPYEEKLISDYIDGKTMKEEDEIFVLNTLHSDNKIIEPKCNDISQNQENGCMSSKTTSLITNDKRQVTDNASNMTTAMQSYFENESNFLKKINCFRLSIDSLILTSAGWKKINQSVDSRHKNVSENVPPPGATYFVECNFVEESPRTLAQQWKATPLRFCSRRQIEHVVYFGQSSAHGLRPPHSLANTQSDLAAMSCLVCWRHLNQRVPALLGNFSLADTVTQLCLENTLTLPVTNESGDTVAHIRLTLELGKDKLYFGKALLGACNELKEKNEDSILVYEDDKANTTKQVPLDVNDLCSKYGGLLYRSDKAVGISFRTQKMAENKSSIHFDTSVPVCLNCKQSMILTNINCSSQSSFCVSCNNQGYTLEPNFMNSVLKNLATKDQRHHEFLFGIDAVIGFPMFATVQEELSCYVDYKFPEVTSNLTAEMASSETTSKVVSCEPQPMFSSLHQHTLSLPVVLPLSPLLANCSPGVTLRLWLRYYKPTPRDHMVAMALLPMEELTLMELEFDKKHQNKPVIKALELPLALVPSSVTAPFQKCSSLGFLRLTVSYSNYISSVSSSKELDEKSLIKSKSEILTTQFQKQITEKEANGGRKENVESQNLEDDINILPFKKYVVPNALETNEVKPIASLLDQILISSDKTAKEDLGALKNRFWTGPFGKSSYDKSSVLNEEKEKKLSQQNFDCSKSHGCSSKSTKDQNNKSLLCLNSKEMSNNVGDYSQIKVQNSSLPVLKEDFDILAESLEKKFNQLQSELMKERQKGLVELNHVVRSSKPVNTYIGSDMNDFAFHPLSSNSSMESLSLILGPPAEYKDLQNTVLFSKNKRSSSDLQSVSDTISGFLKEEKEVENLSSNESQNKEEHKIEPVKQNTFKARIKVDRAVNLKAVKAPSNGKKCKVPPSTWVSFGTGDCCEESCGSGGLVCTGQRFTTHIVRKNYNPIWNLSWDVDLSVNYLQQVNKRLVFRVFEENLECVFGFASANLSILTSGLPCLSSWLSINDLSGACKGQIKVVVTPLEDLSRYQDNSVFDTEEYEFDELREKESTSSSQDGKGEAASSNANGTKVLFNEEETSKSLIDKKIEPIPISDNLEEDFEVDDHVSADDVISDYKNTLENNFRNEMAGLENLIKFLRVGSMSNEISLLGATENKENSNPTFQQPETEVKTASNLEITGKYTSCKNILETNPVSIANHKDKILVDASTETSNKEMPSNSYHSEDILSKLLNQISMFQLPTVKITDNTSQTVPPITKETFTETCDASINNPSSNNTIYMRNVFTQTDDDSSNYNSQQDSSKMSQTSHVCGELAPLLLQHFLTCKPLPVKVTDSACQTVCQEKNSTANSSGVFMGSQLSGVSTEILNKSEFPAEMVASGIMNDWISSEEAHTNCDRLIQIDNNIKDLENFLKENLVLAEQRDVSFLEAKEELCCSSSDEMVNSIQPNDIGNSHSSSDVESLDRYSQVLRNPRETPDGGNNLFENHLSVLDDISSKSTAKRQGTFVIDKSKNGSDDASTEK